MQQHQERSQPGWWRLRASLISPAGTGGKQKLELSHDPRIVRLFHRKHSYSGGVWAPYTRIALSWQGPQNLDTVNLKVTSLTPCQHTHTHTHTDFWSALDRSPQRWKRSQLNTLLTRDVLTHLLLSEQYWSEMLSICFWRVIQLTSPCEVVRA